MDPGSVTLTIGDQTWEFDSFVRAYIRDESGEGRFEGDDLTHEVYITDISGFENPSIDFQFFRPSGIVIDGNDLMAEGLFDDALTDEVEEIPGTLEATCGTVSRR